MASKAENLAGKLGRTKKTNGCHVQSLDKPMEYLAASPEKHFTNLAGLPHRHSATMAGLGLAAEGSSSTCDKALWKRKIGEEQLPNIVYWHHIGNFTDLSSSEDKNYPMEVISGKTITPTAGSTSGARSTAIDSGFLSLGSNLCSSKHEQTETDFLDPMSLTFINDNDTGSLLPLKDAAKAKRPSYLYSHLANEMIGERASDDLDTPYCNVPSNRYHVKCECNRCDDAKLQGQTDNRILENQPDGAATRTEGIDPMDRTNTDGDCPGPYSLSGKVVELEHAFNYLINSSLRDEDKLDRLRQMDHTLDYLVTMATQAQEYSVADKDERLECGARDGGTLRPDDEAEEKVTLLPLTSSSQPRSIFQGTLVVKKLTDRPKSFLKDEMDEFERIFSELFFSKHKRMSNLTKDMVKPTKNEPSKPVPSASTHTEGRTSQTAVSAARVCSPARVSKVGHLSRPSIDGLRTEADLASQGAVGGAGGGSVGSAPRFDNHDSRFQRSFQGGNPAVKQPTPQERASYRIPRQKVKVVASTAASKRRSYHEENLPKLTDDEENELGLKIAQLQSSLRRVKELSDGGDKLFTNLLDDLDNINSPYTDSARKRKKARDMFSEWIFSPDKKSECDELSGCNCTSGVGGCQLYSVQTAPKSTGACYSVCSRGHQAVTRLSVTAEDDADSGYYTNDNSLQRDGLRRAPGEYTLTRDDLRKRIENFNNNNYGLIMSLQQDSNTFQGFIRVHMNLIRPISMSLTVRPPSIYDALGQEEEVPQESHADTQIASFYLPKDTSKVIHIVSSTTAQEVIRTLLGKYRITDNPRKFALYEKEEIQGIKGGKMRKLSPDDLPLPICLSWGAEGLEKNRFVLQENDTGDVIWEAFSVPELENFLRILNKEEEEYVEQIKAKYKLMKFHMDKRCQQLLQKASVPKKQTADSVKDSAGKETKKATKVEVFV